MKRTDFTQNFPGGIIKGDSRCREGEEMEEKIDLNVCYRKAFEALGITGSVQKFADYITEYAPVVFWTLEARYLQCLIKEDIMKHCCRKVWTANEE